MIAVTQVTFRAFSALLRITSAVAQFFNLQMNRRIWKDLVHSDVCILNLSNEATKEAACQPCNYAIRKLNIFHLLPKSEYRTIQGLGKCRLYFRLIINMTFNLKLYCKSSLYYDHIQEVGF